jgi:hypothetical protein
MKPLLRHKRILEQISRSVLVNDFGQTIEVTYPTEGDFPTMKGNLFVFTPAQFDVILDQVVEFTYNETFNLIKRTVGTPNDD